MKTGTLEVVKTANGYLVHDKVTVNGFLPMESVQVAESFASLVRLLAERFGESATDGGAESLMAKEQREGILGCRKPIWP